jgi:ferredoxin
MLLDRNRAAFEQIVDFQTGHREPSACAVTDEAE